MVAKVKVGVAGRAEPSATEYDDVDGDVHEIGGVVIVGYTQAIL